MLNVCCEVCKTDFRTYPSTIRRSPGLARFCSKECKVTAQPLKMPKVCHYRKCSICSVRIRHNNIARICNTCETEAIAFETELEAKNTAHAAKYKCRQCGIGLGMDRMRFCGEHDPSKSVEIDEDFIYFVDKNRTNVA